MLYTSRLFTFICIGLIVCTIGLGLSSFLPTHSVAAQNRLMPPLYLPWVSGSADNSERHLAIDATLIHDELWPTYMSEKGGYSLRYPSGWMVNEGQKGTLIISPPTGKPEDKITVIYLGFEKSETDDLSLWAEKFFALGLGPDLKRTFSPVSLAVVDPDDTSQQVYMQYISPVPGEAYFITHGRLVLQISTDSEAEGFTGWLQTVANSVVFVVDGPTNQEQLSYPEQPPDYQTIEDWQQYQDDANLAIDAVNYRLQTGEVANHLLEIMSERARKEYERSLSFAAEYIAEMDRQRES